MDHVAIMKKSWGLTQKILTGEKKVESRWYRARYAPWDRIRPGEVVYFKGSGEPVVIKAEVEKVMQFSGLTPGKVEEILYKYGQICGLDRDEVGGFLERFKNKKYCMLIFLKNPQRVDPFEIDKSGFGAMAAWISVEDVGRVKKASF